jgi:thermitase
MQEIRYFDGTRIRRLELQNVYEAPQRPTRHLANRGFAKSTALAPQSPQSAGTLVVNALHADSTRLATRFNVISEERTFLEPVGPGQTTVVATETVAVDGARKADVTFLSSKFGLETVDEGSHGKVLMKVPGDVEDPVARAADAALALHERPGPSTANPNFLRVVQRTPKPQAPPGAPQWALDNGGQPGVIGADVAALAAWTITRGDGAIRVAILDEGVDTKHPYLKPAVVAEADFVDGNPTAMPDGNDAHGTACAGIVASRNRDVSGLAPEVSLVAARIAKSNAEDVWIFDDFATADAIDWCWDTAKADVLSNSWGGGPPVPGITRAFERARTNGRGGRGSVVLAAAGNSQVPVSYPGTLRELVTVGASNQWDKRKTKTSQDGENWWGSNYGPELDVMGPGVKIATTDISGARGYSPGQTTSTFNGTSAATPFAAAVVALMLSVKPTLTEARVAELLRLTADRIGTAPPDKYTGYGRVNAYAAMRAARREP